MRKLYAQTVGPCGGEPPLSIYTHVLEEGYYCRVSGHETLQLRGVLHMCCLHSLWVYAQGIWQAVHAHAHVLLASVLPHDDVCVHMLCVGCV